MKTISLRQQRLSSLREARPVMAASGKHATFSAVRERDAFSPENQITLRRGEVLTIHDRQISCELRVERGTIWLTDTPASGDHVLFTGDRFVKISRAPWVVQALEDCLLVLA